MDVTCPSEQTPAIFSPLLDRSKRGSPPAGGEIPPIKRCDAKPAGGGKPLPYGYQMVQIVRAGGTPSRRALQGYVTRCPPHHGGAPVEARPKRVARTALWSTPHSGNGRENGEASEITPRQYISTKPPNQALP